MKSDRANYYREELGLSASDKSEAGKAIMAGSAAAHFDDSEIPVAIMLGVMRDWVCCTRRGLACSTDAM